jgi:hypothetical protein
VLDDGQLVPQAKRVPLGYLPGGPWHPLTDWLQGTLPPAEWAKPRSHPSRYRLCRQRSCESQNYC